MPVYNVASYLDDAIKSILGQTFRNFELILVDDGSTDSSGRIAAGYRDRDRRVVLVRQPNAGLSAARNTGLAHARGMYVYCIDGDDMLEKTALRKIYRMITRNGYPDAVVFKAKPFLDDVYEDDEGRDELRIHTVYYKDVLEDGLYSGPDLYLQMKRRHNFLPSAWLYMIRADFLRETKLKFVEGIVNEDEVFSRQMFFRAGNIYLTNEKFYQYRLRKGSIMQSGIYRHRVLSLVTVAEEIYTLYERENIPELKADALRFYNEAAGFQREHFPVDPEIAGRLRTSSLFQPNLQKITPTGQDFEMNVPLPETPGYAEGTYQPLTARIVSSYILDDSIFFDLGAGYGYFSLIAASRAKAKKVVAVEPEPFVFEILSGNAGLNNFQNLIMYKQPLPEDGKQDTVEFLHFLDDGVSNLFFKINANGREMAVLDGIRSLIDRASSRIRMIVEYDTNKMEQAGFAPQELLKVLFDLGFDILAVDEASQVVCKVEAGHPFKVPESDQGKSGADFIRLLCLPKISPVSVLFFSHSSLFYGAEKSLQVLASELPRRGMVSTVVLPFDGPLKRSLEEKGVVTLVHLYGWWSDQDPVDDAESQPRLARHLRSFEERLLPLLQRINPDVIVTNTSVIPWGGVGAFLLNKPHIWYVHELGAPERGINFFYPREEIAEYIQTGANLIISNSVFTQRKFFGESAQTRTEIIYPFSELEQKKSMDAESYFQKEGSFKLACLGAILPGKGQADAVHALKELVPAGRIVELVFAGDPDTEYHKMLMGLVEAFDLTSCVHFAGFLDHPYALYEQADAILVCYRDEPFGLVTLEAMRLGKPVIAAASGGTLELIEDEIDGLLYAPGDPIQLAERIGRLIDNPELRGRLGANAAEKAREKFTRDAALTKFFQVLREVSAEPYRSSQDYFYWLRDMENIVWQIRLSEKDAQIAQKDAQLAQKDAQIAEIHSSKGWRLVLWLRKIRLLIVPPNSRRARAGRTVLSILQRIMRK